MTEFADLPEHQATGRIAEIYDEIRVYGAVPYVSSLQRQLATIPGCLEWVWEAVRPAFIDGRVPLAAWGAVEGLDKVGGQCVKHNAVGAVAVRPPRGRSPQRRSGLITGSRGRGA